MRRALVLAALVGLSACGPKATPKPAEPTAAVRTVVAVRADLTESLTAYGAAEFDPAGVAALTAPFEANVTAVHIAVGQAVRAGEALVTLAPSPAARLELDRLARDARQAERDLQRLRRLRADGLASDAEVETARVAAVGAAEASRSLSGRVAAGVLRAPRAGVVDTLTAAVGGMVAAGAPVASVGATSQLNARLGVEVEDAQRIVVGAPVRLEAMHEAGAERTARVSSVDRRVDPATRLAAVLVDLPPSGPYLPGETLKGEIVVGVRPNAVVVPRQALLYDGDKPYAFVVRGGRAHRRDLTLGVEAPDRVEVTAGVRSGEQVVVVGGPALADGMAVKDATGSGRARPRP